MTHVGGEIGNMGINNVSRSGGTEEKSNAAGGFVIEGHDSQGTGFEQSGDVMLSRSAAPRLGNNTSGDKRWHAVRHNGLNQSCHAAIMTLQGNQRPSIENYGPHALTNSRWCGTVALSGG